MASVWVKADSHVKNPMIAPFFNGMSTFYSLLTVANMYNSPNNHIIVLSVKSKPELNLKFSICFVDELK